LTNTRVPSSTVTVVDADIATLAADLPIGMLTLEVAVGGFAAVTCVSGDSLQLGLFLTDAVS
jgi:hypothetical protein